MSPISHHRSPASLCRVLAPPWAPSPPWPRPPSPCSRLVDEADAAQPADGVVDAELRPRRQRRHADVTGVRRAAHLTHKLAQLRVGPARVDDLPEEQGGSGRARASANGGAGVDEGWVTLNARIVQTIAVIAIVDQMWMRELEVNSY